jgi:hypothetical protein
MLLCEIHEYTAACSWQTSNRCVNVADSALGWKSVIKEQALKNVKASCQFLPHEIMAPYLSTPSTTHDLKAPLYKISWYVHFVRSL